MIRTTLAAAALALAVPATAQEDSPYVDFIVLKPAIALKAAQAALDHCTEQGYQTGVHVVDRFGTPQVFLRERYAGAHVYETSYRKAWTAASFQISTTELAQATGPDSNAAAIRHLSTALPLGGGLLIEGSGSLLGAIGVSGAPSPALDDECARAGIDAIFDDIGF